MIRRFDEADTQGIARFGYRQLPEASFLLLRIQDTATAAAWLLAAPVTDSKERPGSPDTALHLAFSRGGLERLGVAREVLAGFSAEFNTGMVGGSRPRRLGDVGPSAPTQWAWGGEGAVPDLVVMLYAKPGALASFQSTIERQVRAAGFDILSCLPTSDSDGREPFGFADGISQPAIDWERTLPLEGDNRIEYGNAIALGEVLLGYPNEYGQYTDRPLLPRGATDGLPPAEDAPDRLDLGRNGSYLVFRQYRQDVRGFWQFLDRAAQTHDVARERLAEALVGRTMAGTPLVEAVKRNIPGVGPDADDLRRNQFTYETDPNGLRCPLGAHVRRANPRTGDLSGAHHAISRILRSLGFMRRGVRDDLIASARFHRILRRGREYGPGLSPDEALTPAPPDDPERGLYFICLNANIARQFEFTQNAWLMNAKFNGLSDETDPLVGNRELRENGLKIDQYSLPGPNGVRVRLKDLPYFVTVRGGAYFFLPGLQALRYIARGGTRGAR